MPYIIPAAVLGTSVIANPQTQVKSSFTNLAASGSVALTFDTQYSPIFDVFILVVGVDCTLQGAVRFAKTGSGSTWRDLDPEHTYTVTAGAEFSLRALRLPGIQARWTLTAGAGAATTTLEFQVVNRSE